MKPMTGIQFVLMLIFFFMILVIFALMTYDQFRHMRRKRWIRK